VQIAEGVNVKVNIKIMVCSPKWRIWDTIFNKTPALAFQKNGICCDILIEVRLYNHLLRRKPKLIFKCSNPLSRKSYFCSFIVERNSSGYGDAFFVDVMQCSLVSTRLQCFQYLGGELAASVIRLLRNISMKPHSITFQKAIS
jgi:hypothetical protein